MESLNNSNNDSEPILNSRRIFMTGVVVGAGAASVPYWFGRLFNSPTPCAVAQPAATAVPLPTVTLFPTDTPPILITSPIETPNQTPMPEEYTIDVLLNNINVTIERSLSTGFLEFVTLPEGQMIVDRPITFKIPEGAKVSMKGHDNGSVLKLTPEMSRLQRDANGEHIWGTFGVNNIIYVEDLSGELHFNNITFDGGLEGVPSGNKMPPKSPWDSLILAVGPGEAGYNHRYSTGMPERDGKRKGVVRVFNCEFTNSESAGIVAQNLHGAYLEDIKGHTLDALAIFNWTDTARIIRSQAENLTSDGVYANAVGMLKAARVDIVTARQGIDLQGVGFADIQYCNFVDCAKAFEVLFSETDRSTPSGNILINSCKTDGCMHLLSVTGTRQVEMRNSVHTNVGRWAQYSVPGDFYHFDGVRDPRHFTWETRPIFAWGPAPDLKAPASGLMPNMLFSEVYVQLAENSISNWGNSQFLGVTYS